MWNDSLRRIEEDRAWDEKSPLPLNRISARSRLDRHCRGNISKSDTIFGFGLLDVPLDVITKVGRPRRSLDVPSDRITSGRSGVMTNAFAWIVSSNV